MASIIKIGDGWRAQIRKVGRKSISKTFRTKAEAVRWANEVEGSNGNSAALTVSALIEKYRELRAESDRPITPKSNTHYMLAHLANPDDGLGAMRLEDIDTQALVKWCQRRSKEGAGPSTLNMHMSALATAIRYTKSYLNLRLGDPVGDARPTLHHYGLIGPGKERERRPTAQEIDLMFAWFAVHAPLMIDIVTIYMTAGIRRGEIARIVWVDVDEDRRSVVVRDRKDPRQKMGNDQEVPLVRGAWEVIDRQPTKEKGGRIFPVSVEWMSDTFQAARDACGIVDLRLHDMRHEAVSVLFESGWQIPQVAAVSGHKNWKNLRRYTQIDPVTLHDQKVVPLKRAS